MGDEKGLKELGEEFCTAVRIRIQSKYTDIHDRLDHLMTLIQQNKDSRAITSELDLVEKALKDQKELIPNITGCAKKIRAFWDVKKEQKTGTIDKGKDKAKKSKSSPSGTALNKSGDRIAQTQDTSNSGAGDSITSFLEQLVGALHNLLDDSIDTASKAKLPSVPTVSDKELEKRLKDMHAKVEETAKLCSAKNREINQASEFLNELYKKATHVDEGQVTDQRTNKGTEPSNLSKDNKKGHAQGYSPAPAKQESGEVSKLDEKFTRILSAWKTMEETKKEINQVSEFLNELYKKATHVDEGQVTDQRKNKSTKLSNLSKDNKKGHAQGYSPAPAKQESGEVSKLDEKFTRILSAWKTMEESKKDVELASKLLADLSRLSSTTRTDHRKESEAQSNDQSAEREHKGVLSTRNDGATIPYRSEISQKLQQDFEVVKTTLIQMKDTEQLKSDVKEAGKNTQKYQSADRKKLEEEVESLRMRLSELAGAKLSKDNPDITDLSDPNRPTKLKEHYSELYSNEWTDAFQKLSESNSKLSEGNVIQYLLDILLEGFEYCKRIKDFQKEGLLEIILYPATDFEQSQVKKADVKMNEMFATHLAEAVKLSGEITGEHVAKAFFWSKDMRNKFGQDFETSEKYITKCVKLCWLMQVQTPPVCIDLPANPGEKFDNDKYKEYTKKGKKIDFIVWPPLRRNESGLLIEKGVAQGK